MKKENSSGLNTIEGAGLFKGTAEYYAKYRPGYRQELFDYLVKYYKLDGKGRLLDLGCGTGQLAMPLAKYFKEVIAVDIDQEMLDIGRREAERVGVKNIKWLLTRAEVISSDIGMSRLTVIGSAFHWMDRQKVLAKIYEITEPGGGLAVVSDSSTYWKNIKSLNWKEVRKNIVAKYLGEKRRAGNSFYNEFIGSNERFEDILSASKFGKPEEFRFDYARIWTLDEVVGFLYSTSYASRRLLGNKVDEFEKELRAALLEAEPSGIFKENVYSQALLVKK